MMLQHVHVIMINIIKLHNRTDQFKVYIFVQQ